MLDIALVFVTIVLAVWWWTTSARPSGLPPSPGFALPIVGHLYLVKTDLIEQIKEWRKQLGDLITLQLGQERVILINGYDAIHEVLVKQHHYFLERPNTFYNKEMFKHKGLIVLGSGQWKEHRAFVQSTMRSLGMGRNVMGERISLEVEYLLAAMTDTKSEPTEFDHLVKVCVSNIICGVSFGKRFDHNDQSFLKWLRLMDGLFRGLEHSSVLNYLPFLQHLPGDLLHYKKLVEDSSTLRKWIWEKSDIDGRQINQNDDTCEDIVQAFLTEMEKKKMAEIPLSTIDEENMLSTVYNLFLAGTETTSSTIIFALFYMVSFPDIQERLFQEIKEHVGASRLPTLADKSKLKYLNAFIMETQRYTSLTPLTLDRLSTQDVRVKGHIIPKGSTVIVVLDSVLCDADVWGDPQNFRPDRFLTSSPNDVKKEFIPFSLGRRYCVGEALAVMELYLFLSGLIQRFQFQPETSNQKPSLAPQPGLTRSPKPCKLRAVPRFPLE